MEQERLSFEDAIGRLEEIVTLLERGEQKLEESLSLFEEGVRLARYCQSILDRAEERIRILADDGSEEDFSLEGEKAR